MRWRLPSTVTVLLPKRQCSACPTNGWARRSAPQSSSEARTPSLGARRAARVHCSARTSAKHKVPRAGLWFLQRAAAAERQRQVRQARAARCADRPELTPADRCRRTGAGGPVPADWCRRTVSAPAGPIGCGRDPDRDPGADGGGRRIGARAARRAGRSRCGRSREDDAAVARRGLRAHGGAGVRAREQRSQRTRRCTAPAPTWGAHHRDRRVRRSGPIAVGRSRRRRRLRDRLSGRRPCAVPFPRDHCTGARR